MVAELNTRFGYIEYENNYIRFVIPTTLKSYKNYFIDYFEIFKVKDNSEDVPILVPTNLDAANLQGWFVNREGSYWVFYVDKHSNIQINTIYEFYVR